MIMGVNFARRKSPSFKLLLVSDLLHLTFYDDFGYHFLFSLHLDGLQRRWLHISFIYCKYTNTYTRAHKSAFHLAFVCLLNPRSLLSALERSKTSYISNLCCITSYCTYFCLFIEKWKHNMLLNLFLRESGGPGSEIWERFPAVCFTVPEHSL